MKRGVGGGAPRGGGGGPPPPPPLEAPLPSPSPPVTADSKNPCLPSVVFPRPGSYNPATGQGDEFMSEKVIKVLLIEGDADESSVIKQSLLDCPDRVSTFAVKEAARLSTASRLLAQERFDAVLLDLALAQSVGIEGFRKVHAQAPETPILILTGLQDEAVAVEAVREGAQDYVVKGTP